MVAALTSEFSNVYAISRKSQINSSYNVYMKGANILQLDIQRMEYSG